MFLKNISHNSNYELLKNFTEINKKAHATVQSLSVRIYKHLNV